MRKSILCGLTMALMATNAFALSVNVSYNNNSKAFSVSPLSGFATTGAMMGSMSVRAEFEGGLLEETSWAMTTSTTGGVTGNGFTLTESGDTFGGIWSLTNISSLDLTSIIIDAGAGNSVFDVISNPNLSPGSARGWGFTVKSADSDLAINATYSGAVSVDNFFYGDLYRYLKLDLTNFGSQDTLSFVTDTDSVSDLRGEVGMPDVIQQDTTPEAVPEPSTILLLGGGLAGLLYYRRKK